MLKSIKHILAVAVVLTAVVPALAYARPNPDVADPSLASGSAPTPAAASVARAGSPGESFQWADAGVGAAAMLGLVGAGGAVVLVRRRRVGNQLAS
jgi:hypothetical protein